MTGRCGSALLCVLCLAPAGAQDQALEAAVAQVDSRILVDPALAGVRVRGGDGREAGALRRWADSAGGWLERLPGGLALIHGPRGRPLGALGGASISVVGTEVSALAWQIADAGGVALRVDPRVVGPCPLSLRDVPALVALGLLARLAEADLWRADNGEWHLLPARRISVDRVQGTLGETAAQVARAGGLSLVVAPEHDHLPVAIAAGGRTASELLRALAEAGDVPLGAGRVWTLGAVSPDALTAARSEAQLSLAGLLPLRDVLLELAEVGGVDLLLGPTVDGEIRIQLEESTWSDALAAIAAVSSLSIHVEGGQRLVTRGALSPPASPGGLQTNRRALARGAPATVWFSTLATEAGISLDLPDPFSVRIHARFAALPAGRVLALSAWSHGLRLSSKPGGGWRLELPPVRQPRPLRAPPLSPSTDALLRHLELAIEEGQAARGRRTLDLLEALPRGTQARATSAGAALREALERALTAVAVADPQARADPLARLERLVSAGGQPAALVLRRLLVRWNRRWSDDGARGAVQELLGRCSAEPLLSRLRQAYLDGAGLEARDAYRAILDLVRDARSSGLDPGWIDQLQADADSVWELARPPLELQQVPLALTGSIDAGGSRAAVAIVNGHPVRPGEQVLDAFGSPIPGLSLLGVEAGGARFDYRGRRFLRPLVP